MAVLRYDGSGGVNNLHFYIKKTNGTLFALQANNVLSTGTWMHIAGTYDGTTMKLYLNGKLLSSASPAGGLYPPSGSFSFSSGGSEAFNGKMDEVSVWNDARSVSDIREDMYRAAPLAESRLLNYWQFNHGSGTTLSDMKGTATGTLNNMLNSNWVSSTIPFSAGATKTKILYPNYNGYAEFTGTNMTFYFQSNVLSDTVVVTRIDTVPNIYPIGSQNVYDYQYWVRKFYTSDYFIANQATVKLNKGFTPAQTAHPERVKIYTRSNNSDGAWTFFNPANNITTDGSVTFDNYPNYSSIDGQFIVCSDLPENTPGTTRNFDGTNDYVNCGNVSSLNITGPITIEAWIKANIWNTNSWGGTILGKDNTNSTGYNLRCGNNGMLSFVVGSGGTWHEVLSSAIMTTGKWYCVAAVYNGTNMSIYINGVLCGQQPLSSAIGISSQPLYFGNSPGYSNRFFDGKIDEVRIWNTARTQSQIQSDMYNTMQGNETGLVDYWQFNNSRGSILTDVVGTSNGTLVNMDTTTCWYESYAMVVPAPEAASNISSTAFTANWTAPAVGSVTSYKLDVSTDSTFTSMVTGYNNLDCGNTLSKNVTGLNNGTTYYLQWLQSMDHNMYWQFHYIQTADINAAPSRNWDSGNGFSPIGRFSIPSFTGTYNDMGHTVDSIYINRTGAGYVGFFGQINNAKIDSLNLTNVSITSNDGHIGALVGMINSNSTISHCSSNGSVSISLNNSNIGGLIGTANSNSDTIKYCYSSANVNCSGTSNTYTGGFIGKNSGFIIQCYASGLVSGSGTYIGGLAGNSANADQSYWDIETTGQITGGYNTDTTHVHGRTSAQTRHLYLNGVEMPLTGTPASVTANTQPLYLTNYYNDALIVNNLFRGYVEEVRLWNTAMTYSQIRENMHLPLTGSETGLVSYWQFDEGQPPTVFDKKGVNNGAWYSSAFNQYITSTIPFGSGFSHTQVVNATGNYDFTNTGLSINFAAKSGLDSIVVAKIDTFPNVNPAGIPVVFDLQYWDVHKYGNGSLTASLTFTLTEDLTLQDQLNPSGIKLYTRGGAADTGWALLAPATTVNAATNQVTFEGITGFSQFIIGKTVLVPANQTVANTTIHNGETECFNATEVVSVSNFTVETGGDATFIAGGQIHFTPGVVVQPGGYLHGYITTTDGYCISPAPSTPEVSGEEEETPAVVGESWFKLYPNPTRGSFFLEFKDVTRDEVQVTIYGIQGNKILQQKVFLEKSRNFCLDNAQAGIYIVRISTASETIFKKIVKL